MLERDQRVDCAFLPGVERAAARRLVDRDAIERVAKSGKPVDRVNVRDAIAETKLKTLQGEVSFDENGDLKQRVIAVFQVKHDTAHPVDDLIHQYRYVGVAPQV